MNVEPWLRGPIAGVDPLVAPILYAFQQAREDLAKCTDGLTAEQLWTVPHGFGSVGFHVRHIAGSTDRLITYLQGRELSAEQMRELEDESRLVGWSRAELLEHLDRAITSAEATVRQIDPATLRNTRAVGRKKLPTTVIGLLTHIAEHTQRHVGQAISAAKWAQIQAKIRKSA
ncbi:MAG TPA: DinB family protein [Candidatus Solibacter sp.]|nr:DinB family protein [Candidatus Solibacter sp.]